MRTLTGFPLFISFFLIQLGFVNGQDTYQQILRIPDTTLHGLSAFPLKSGQIAISGYAEIGSNWQGSISLLDAQGSVAWTRLLRHTAASGEGVVSDVLQTADGALLVAYVVSTADNGARSYIVKISAEGAFIWAQELRETFATLRRIVAIKDGYIAVGSTAKPNEQEYGVVFKINETGNVLWQTHFKKEPTALFDAWEDSRGFIYVVGQMNADGSLSQLSPAGELVWTKNYGSTQFDNFSRIAPASNGNILLGGASQGFSSGSNLQAWVAQTDADGNLRWSNTYSVPDRDMSVVSVQMQSGDRAILCITETGTGQSGNGAALIQINGQGAVTWQKTYGPAGSNARFSDAISLPNNAGIVAIGDATAGLQGNTLLVKTDADGNTGYCCPSTGAFAFNAVTPTAATIQVEKMPVQAWQPAELTLNALSVRSENTCQPFNTDFSVSAKTICLGENVAISFPSPTNGINYTWTFPGGTPDRFNGSVFGAKDSITYVKSGKYAITLFANGCPQKKDSIEVREMTPIWPNAFTPDGVGKNELFPLENPLCPSYYLHIQIYNRWGELLYDADKAWDGTVNGIDAPADVYIYHAEYSISKNGQKIPVVNTVKEVTLIR